MGYRHLGWSMILGGALMCAVGFVSSSPMAVLVAWIGATLLVTGLVFLWFGAMEGGGMYSGERWGRPPHQP